MWRLSAAIWLLEQLLKRRADQLAALNIDDDVKMALQPLRRSAKKVNQGPDGTDAPSGARR